MGFLCKALGHKWNKLPGGGHGCTCARCGEHRDEGHDYVAQSGTCAAVCSACGETVYNHEWQGPACALACVWCGTKAAHYLNAPHQWRGCACVVCGEPRKPILGEYQGEHEWDGCKCARCGKTRDEGHDWRGCTCARCGKVRDEGHVLNSERLEPVIGSVGGPMHVGSCAVCGKRVYMPHSFEHLPGCRYQCAECGAEVEWHDFRDGTCSECGLDESEHYCGLILSGKVRYDQWEYSPVDGSRMQCIDHVRSVTALRRISLSDNKNIYSICRMHCARMLAEIAKAGEADSHDANLALRELVLKADLGWDAPRVAGWITETDVASDPAIAEVVRQVERASIEYDNAMIASDSGIGRSG
ncbi:MAG: hypothetical protein IKF14_02460 [Atopobiaceae bacterium]|nr:hypothetical protein [Atopobiaceae bacterium]